MAAAEILATGSTAASSNDVEIAAGASLTVALKDRTLNCQVEIRLKDDDSVYHVVGKLSNEVPALLIVAAGTYQFRRVAGAACGVYSG